MDIFPIDPVLARRAMRLQRKGLKGKATAEKLGRGITTDQANLLASVGAADEAEEAAVLNENEVKIILALAKLQRYLRRKGETSSPKAWMLCRPTGLSEGQIGRLTRKRLNPRHYDGTGKFGFLSHSRNGHIWMESPGWALARLLEKARPALAGEG